jgi:adenylosuccinate lyase
VIEKLVVHPEAMQANLDRLGGLVHSQRVLLALTQKGMSREGAYGLVQRLAMETWRNGGSFRDRLAAEPEVTRVLDSRALDRLFDMAYHARHVDTIFKRVFGKGKRAPRSR